LLAKDEVSQQQFDTLVATAEAQKAAADSARSQVAEAEAGIRVGESKLTQARAGTEQAHAELQNAQPGPPQAKGIKARTAAASRARPARASVCCRPRMRPGTS